MTFLSDIPAWLGGAIAGALATPLVKMGIDALTRRRKLRRAAVDSLEQLKALLSESWSTAQSQNSHRNLLHKRVREKYGEAAHTGRGYDEDFYRTFDQMDQEERELLSLIRGLTKHGMFQANTRLSSWLDSNRSAKHLIGNTSPTIERLDKHLTQLRRHLTEWFSKFHSVFDDDKKRSLVYLADEKGQGTGFPRGIDESVEKVLNEISGLGKN